MRHHDTTPLQPSPNVRDLAGYVVPRAPAPTDLRLDSNEGPAPSADLLRVLPAIGPNLFCRYQKPHALEAQLAAGLNVSPEQVLVTAGGDDAIDRACRAFLFPDREIILPTPAFEMFHHFAHLSGGRVVNTPWSESSYPTDAVIRLANPRTGIIVITSPNNPTGAVATAADLARISAACPSALLLVDQAYGPFADEDLTPAALRLPNAVVVHSFSKVYGMAGLRVGFAAGPAHLIQSLRVAGGPYPVSNISQALVATWQRDGREITAAYLRRVREERAELFRVAADLGWRPFPSQANFVFVQCRDPHWLRDALAGLGIAVRLIPTEADFPGGVRITCPGEPATFDRLLCALRTVAAPKAVLFDMDGVLADVSRSYREAIAATAASYGVSLTSAEIASAKAEPGANDDWALTQRLLSRHGVAADLAEVTARFEEHYQGTSARPGLRELETCRTDISFLERLAARFPLGIVTGRPRADAERFLQRFELTRLFAAVVCREDGPLKPDPAPVRIALDRLKVDSAWLVGDAPDDLQAARAAGVLPIGVPAADDYDIATVALYTAGAARVLADLHQLEELLP